MKFFCCLLLLSAVACGVLEEDISGDRIWIVGPAERAEVPAGAVEFRWKAVPYAAEYELTLMSPSFGERRIVADTVLRVDTLGSRSYGCRMELGGGEYEWRVAAFNPGYATYSEVRTLTVQSVGTSSDGPEQTGWFGLLPAVGPAGALENLRQ